MSRKDKSAKNLFQGSMTHAMDVFSKDQKYHFAFQLFLDEHAAEDSVIKLQELDVKFVLSDTDSPLITFENVTVTDTSVIGQRKPTKHVFDKPACTAILQTAELFVSIRDVFEEKKKLVGSTYTNYAKFFKLKDRVVSHPEEFFESAAAVRAFFMPIVPQISKVTVDQLQTFYKIAVTGESTFFDSASKEKTIQVLKTPLCVVQEGFTGPAKDGEECDHLPENRASLLEAFEYHRVHGFYSRAGSQQAVKEESKAPQMISTRLTEESKVSSETSLSMGEIQAKLTALTVQMERAKTNEQFEQAHKLYQIFDTQYMRQLQRSQPKVGAAAAGHGQAGNVRQSAWEKVPRGKQSPKTKQKSRQQASRSDSGSQQKTKSGNMSVTAEDLFRLLQNSKADISFTGDGNQRGGRRRGNKKPKGKPANNNRDQ